MKYTPLSLIVASALFLNGCKEATPNKEAWLADPRGHLKVASTGDPQTLDPRYARDLLTANVVANLYEPLLTMSANNTAVPAAAESFTVSQDGLTYTFKIREAKWSDGSTVTSQQFANAWKSQLSRDSDAPNANQLYAIKNGKAVKEGALPAEKLGIETPDARTLIVTLENPLPYFTKLVSTYYFLPMHQNSTSDALITNGPFRLETWKKNNELTAVKNPHYWDVGAVNLDKFSFINLEDHTALQMFQANQLDWAGSPLATLPSDAILSLKKKNQLLTTPSAGLYWFRVNTTKAPLSNTKIRQALAYAINRESLIKNVVQGNQQAALAIIPPSMNLTDKEYFTDDNITVAWELFQQGLKELNMNIEDMPKITLTYSSATERNQKIVQAIQQQWKKVFGDKIELKGMETKSLYQKLSQLDYDISLGSWFADIDDPSNFLDIFSSKTNVGNNTGWENAEYAKALEESLMPQTAEKRKEHLLKAQEILVREMPVIPLFFGTFNYVKKRNAHGIDLSNLGHMYLKHAYIGDGDATELEVLE